MQEIRALLTDIGNTAIPYNLEFIFRGNGKLAGIPSEDVVPIWAYGDRLQYGLSDSFERGLISCGEFRKRWTAELIAKATVAGSESGARVVKNISARVFWDIWNDMFLPMDLLWVEYLRRMKSAGYYLGAVSNINKAHLHYLLGLKRYRPFFSLLDDITASCDMEVQARKPDSRIYSVAFAKARKAADIQPEQIVYIDDVAENALAVHPFGARGIVARTPSQIFADLKAMGARW